MNEHGALVQCRMKLTGENQHTQGKACPSATSSITNYMCTGLGLNLGLYGERLPVNCQNHGMAPCKFRSMTKDEHLPE